MRQFQASSFITLLIVASVAAFAGDGQPSTTSQRTTLGNDELKERFGEQQFVPTGGFVIRVGQVLPKLVWEQPGLVARVVKDPKIPTRWFDEKLNEVKAAKKPGRYYVYGEAPAPAGPRLRRAMTCCCLGKSVKLTDIARRWIAIQKRTAGITKASESAESVIRRWRRTEHGAVQLAAFLKTDQQRLPSRVEQWQMEDATRHVRLKRKLMGLERKPLVKPTAKLLKGKPSPVLRTAPLEQAGVSKAQIRAIQSQLDAWYAASGEPMAVVIARKGVVILAAAYGKMDGRKVTIDTPMRLDSAMKPLIGLQLAMYVDRGHLRLDEPIGNYLPDFKSRKDRTLTFRAGPCSCHRDSFPVETCLQAVVLFPHLA